MTKYQQVFQNMLNNHQELFSEFRKIHDLYEKDQKRYQKQFDEIGRDVQDIIRRYENILCGKSESSGYGKYSSNLAEKFHAEIKAIFSKIDFIGLQTS